MQIIFAALRRRPALFLLATLILGPALQPTAQAQAPKGPSAVAAARLKHRPPQNWIRHYLGDDRYKIAGGVWKVVSTELDRYYYPAWAPEMLRQPAGIVIGFASAAEAEEAGYRASAYGSSDSLYGLTASEIFAAKRRTVTGNSVQGTRITLSDGVSTVILPRGWKHTRLGQQNINTQGGAISYQMDMISPGGKQVGMVFMFMKLPANVNVESFLGPDKVEQLRQQLRTRAGSDPKVAAAIEGAQFGAGKLGGLSGMTMIPGKGAKLPPGMSGITTIVGKGSKMYMMSAQLSTADKNYGVVVNSFQPR